MNINLKDKIKKLKKELAIQEIYLFGSVARGEQDRYSDIDILIVIDECSEEEFIILKNKFAKILDMPVSWLSVYRISKVKKMQENGSYFLWHIKKEGKVLFSRTGELEKMLHTLPRYKNVAKDIDEYGEILSDIRTELENEYIDVNYELAVMASLVRNTCIAISYLHNRLDFGRNSAVVYCFRKYNIQTGLDEYEELYSYRLYHTGKVDKVLNGTIDTLKKWTEIEANLLEIARKGVVDYERENT